MKPTQEQLDSRKELETFISKMKKPFKDMAAKVKSEWFGRPDAELQAWVEKGHAIEEIKETRGYQMILEQLDKELQWSTNELDVCPKEVIDQLREYRKGLRFIRGYILTTERNAEIAGSVLAGRAGAISKETFVRNATVGERY